MGLSTVIVQWLDAERADDEAGKKETRHRLVAGLWEAYEPVLYALARRHAPGQQSDVLNSAFLKFFQQVDRQKVGAKTRDELFRVLARKVLDKALERARKEGRRRAIRPILAENALLPAPEVEGDPGGLGDDLAQWAVAAEPPPEFEASINEMLEAVPDPRLRPVLLLKIEHLLRSGNVCGDVARANAEIAAILGISDREVGRRLERVREILAPWSRDACAASEPSQGEGVEGHAPA